MQRSASKQKREMIKITNSQNTKRIYDQPSEQLFPKRWPVSNPNRTKTVFCSCEFNNYMFAQTE